MELIFMNVYISDKTSSVGKCISELCTVHNYKLLTEEEKDQADILFFTARRVAPLSFDEAMNETLFQEVDYNLKNTFLCLKDVMESMKQRHSGSIIFIGSGDSEKPNGSAIGFSIAMGGMKLLFRELCIYLAGSGVHCCWIETGELSDHDNPAKTARFAFSAAENEFDGCELRCSAAEFYMK
jgi:NADP-dependent 3-hydroxy acid dehydrogenase YdfG